MMHIATKIHHLIVSQSDNIPSSALALGIPPDETPLGISHLSVNITGASCLAKVDELTTYMHGDKKKSNAHCGG